jgi:sulfite reductase (NADPH) hemoprotein beta-component
MSDNNESSTERIKKASDGLRGTIEKGLENEITGAISEDDTALVKFHGMYQQDDRDRRDERAAKKLDRLYSFMIRLRLPGGFLTPEQWIAIHNIAGENTTGVIKITTRQTLQLHGVIKSKIRPTIQAFNAAKLDSIATCGDVNRNVVCTSHPKQSAIHEQVFAYAGKISEMLKPKTRAYYEIWLDADKIVDKKEEEDPLYQDRYLPRKFKIGLGIPPNNDVDVLANDLGLIAIIKNNKLRGFNIAVGGGLSTTHGNAETYARLGTVLGFVAAGDKAMKAIYEVLTIQRDYGNRSDRKLARVKYTIDKVGVDFFREELERRIGFKLDKPADFEYTERRDYYGWEQNHEGLWYYTPLVENGRIRDDEQCSIKTALLEIAKTGKANFRFTSNQNLIISDVQESDKEIINDILERFEIIKLTNEGSKVRKNSIACVALPTCPLALAEGQRYLPKLIDKIEPILLKYQLDQEEIIIRMTGCPNGCARPYNAEIGFVGTAPGRYNMLLGGDYQGLRLNKIYRESLDESAILVELDGLFESFHNEKLAGESFGDFSVRKRWV